MYTKTIKVAAQRRYALVMQTDVQQVAMCVLNNCFFPLFCVIQELTMQMNLLELILKLQQKETQSGVF